MAETYAYSLDRDNYHGNYTTRSEALAAAMEALKGFDGIPEGIWIGQWVPVDPQTEGHAETLVRRIHDRFEASTGNSDFLKRVGEHELAELDTAIDQAVRAWLAKHNLAPRPTRVRALSEHPVPNVSHVPFNMNEVETHILGPEA